MEDNGQNSMVAMAISLILVLLAASIGFIIFKSGKQAATSALSKTDALSTTLDESTFMDYDGRTIKGIQVASLLGSWSGEEVMITVTTASGNTSNYNYTDGSLTTPSETTAASASVKKNPNYINPNGNFECKVVRDENKSITEVQFVQK